MAERGGDALLQLFRDRVLEHLRFGMNAIERYAQRLGKEQLQQAVVAQACGRDTVLICRTSFHCENENVSWRVLFVPAIALRAAIENAVQSYG